MDVLGQLAAVGAVLGLLGLTLWAVSRRGWAVLLPRRPFFRLPLGRPAGRRLESLERLPLAPQHTLHLVRVGASVLLLASTPAGCTLLRAVEPGEMADAGGGR
jgi:flagellar biogenesis protein FliO